MAEIILESMIAGTDNISKDLTAVMKDIAAKVQRSMDFVGAEMTDALKRRIDNDVYAAYSPKKYERRSENGSLGHPLNDVNEYVSVFNKGAGLTLHYRPRGEHKNAAWDTADGDALIGRIEKKNPSYFPKAQAVVPERPFWQNFVNEMVDMGEMERFFVAAMRLQDAEMEIEETGTEREAQDGSY